MTRYKLNLILIVMMILTILFPISVVGLENNPGANNSVHSFVFSTGQVEGLLRDNISGNEQERKNEPNFISGELLIKFRQEPAANQPGNMAPLKDLNNRFGLVKIEKLFPANMPANSNYPQPAYSSEQLAAGNLPRWYKVTLSKDADVQALVEELKNAPEIEAVEPNYIYQITTVPNDNYVSSRGSWGQYYEDLWGLYKISALSGWDIETGSGQVVVAVVDTGVDITHPDIVNNLWVNKNEIAGNHIDDDSDGYVDDIDGWNFVKCSGEIKDGHGHGTHVAGIVAAAGNNGLGISGVSWHSKIMPLKALNDDGYGVTGDLAKAIRYATDQGARVINMSWGGRSTSQLITEALDYAYSKGVVLVVAAGNSSSDANDFFPANYEKAITVAATGPEDRKAGFSNYGSAVDVSAPGVDILSLRAAGTDMYKDNQHIVDSYYYRASGTSMATPYVSGLAAVILSRHPEFSNDDVAIAITSSADDLGVTGKDTAFGYGRINVYKALEVVDGNMPAIKNIWAIDTPGDTGYSITVFWDNSNLSSTIKGYKIYYNRQPFRNIYEDGVSYFEASPTARPDVSSCVVTGLGDESSGYYFAVIASIFNSQPARTGVSQTSDISGNLISTVQPVYPVNNVVDTTAGDEIIFSGNDPRSKVVIPQGTNNGKILDVTIPAAEVVQLENGNGSRNSTSDYLNPKTLEMTSREFKSSAPIDGRLRIMISYPAEVPSTYENDLRIYELDRFSDQWKILPGIQSVRTNEKSVMAEADGSNWASGATYRLFITLEASSDLNEVRVYPNPYKPNSGLGHTKITFDNLTGKAKIKIFNIASELVRTLEEEDNDGRKEWDADNDSNEKLASGVYIYLLTNDNGQKKIGKLAIIR